MNHGGGVNSASTNGHELSRENGVPHLLHR